MAVAGPVGAAVVGASVGVTTLGVGDGAADVGDGGGVSVTDATTAGEEVATAPLALCTHAAARQPAPAMTTKRGVLTRSVPCVGSMKRAGASTKSMRSDTPLRY